MNNNTLKLVALKEDNRLESKRNERNTERIDRWKVAVGKAYTVLSGFGEGQGYRIYQDNLVVVSPESNAIYIANRDTCQCKAYSEGLKQPCWHRAAHTLVSKVFQIEAIFQK